MVEFELFEELGQFRARREAPHLPFARPALKLAFTGDNSDDAVPLTQEHVAAAGEKAAIANKDPAVCGQSASFPKNESRLRSQEACRIGRSFCGNFACFVDQSPQDGSLLGLVLATFGFRSAKQRADLFSE
jgi:hypothetical protein